MAEVEIGEPALVAGPDASGERPAPADQSGPQGVTDPVPTQPIDLTALERDDAAETDRPAAQVPEAPSPVVTPSSWPAGGPPPPPPPPATAERIGRRPAARATCPAASPPRSWAPAAGTASAVPPWLAARTPPSAQSAPAKSDAFYDELRRAVGDDEAAADTGETGQRSEAAAGQPADDAAAANGDSGAAEPSKSWFGRRR